MRLPEGGGEAVTTITEQMFFALVNQGVKDFSSYALPEVVTLDCGGNQLVVLPALPDVVTLYCGANRASVSVLRRSAGLNPEVTP